MRKLALPEEVLLQIEQPARYIGNEFNSVVKDKEKVALRGAFLFPDVYEIGMSHLGIPDPVRYVQQTRGHVVRASLFPMAGSGPRDA